MTRPVPQELERFWSDLDAVRAAVDATLDEWLPRPDAPPTRLH